jgi:hypothetical protein
MAATKAMIKPWMRSSAYEPRIGNNCQLRLPIMWKSVAPRTVRVISIPAIRDRVVQGALRLILEPIFEADFSDSSFGARPTRSAHDAVEKVGAGLTAQTSRRRRRPVRTAARTNAATVMAEITCAVRGIGVDSHTKNRAHRKPAKSGRGRGQPFANEDGGSCLLGFGRPWRLFLNQTWLTDADQGVGGDLRRHIPLSRTTGRRAS